MKTVMIFLVLALALIAGAAAGKEKAEPKKGQEECKAFCLEKKVKERSCKEACSLNQRFKTTWIGALQCSLKCQKKHGLGTPATKPCEEGCKKKYEEKVAEIADGCHTVCTKEEKEQLGVENCKKICTPSLIYKEMQEKQQAPKN